MQLPPPFTLESYQIAIQELYTQAFDIIHIEPITPGTRGETPTSVPFGVTLDTCIMWVKFIARTSLYREPWRAYRKKHVTVLFFKVLYKCMLLPKGGVQLKNTFYVNQFRTEQTSI